LRGAKPVVRDEDSLRFCQGHFLSAIEKPDDGFRWQQVVDTGAAAASDSKLLGICIFSQYSEQWTDGVERWWIDCLRTLSRTFPDYRLEGFCFHTDKMMDYETTRRLFARAELNLDGVREPQADFRAAILNLGRYRAILSSRFHAIVTASVARIPCVATTLDDYYEAKMRAALKYAPANVKILRPLRDLPETAAQWLKPQLNPNPPL
jgi:exopolysaccharide biosynthesis predicted pyruvyltransferase EpsI